MFPGHSALVPAESAHLRADDPTFDWMVDTDG